jgi:hypothetical protein
VALLPDGIEESGYSTHLSVAMDDADAPAVIGLLCATAAPALMLALETSGSFGIYLRPRPGRIELCGEYVTNGYLQAVAALFTASVRACHAALTDAAIMRELPSRLAVSPKQAAGRYGSFLGRRSAFGSDLYENGREGRVPLASGGAVSLQAQLRSWWAVAKPYLEAHEPGLELMEAIVRGDLPLRTESIEDLGCTGTWSAPTYRSHPLGGAAKSYRRPDFSLTPVAATWDFTLFALDGPSRRAFVSIPRDAFAAFRSGLDAGGFDDVLQRFLVAEPAGRRLTARADALIPGLWDELGALQELLPAEYDPATARLTTAGAFAGVTPGLARSKPRPLKPILVPFAPAHESAPPLPIPAAPQPKPEPPPPVVPSAPQRAPSSGSGFPSRPLVVLAGLAAAAVLAVAGAVASGAIGGSPAVATLTPSATASATGTPSPTATAPATVTPTPLPSETPPAVAPPVPTAAPSSTPPPATAAPAAATPVPTVVSTLPPTPRPTETPRPTSTALHTATPTFSPTRVLDPSRTPTAGCGAAGAICTATPVPVATKAP